EHRAGRAAQPVADTAHDRADADVQTAVADEQQQRRLWIEPRASLERAAAARRRDDAAASRDRRWPAAPGRRPHVSARSRSGRAPVHPVSIEHREGGIDDMKNTLLLACAV